MTYELRKTGIPALGDVAWGTHLCHFYETKQDLVDIFVPYFAAGLENNEFCLSVLSDQLNADEAVAALNPRTSQLESLEFLHYGNLYLRDDVFKVQPVLDRWHDELQRALAKGYSGLRVHGDLSWLKEENWEEFCNYEKALNLALGGQEIIVLCTYPLAEMNASEMLTIARTHNFSIARQNGRSEIFETPGYSRPNPPVFFASPAPQIITQLNDGRIVEVNNAFVQLFGYERAELIGRASTELGLWTNGADYDALIRMRRFAAGVADYETHARNKSGKILDVCIFTARVELAGKPCILATIFDVTERNRIREALERSEAMLKEAQRVAHVGHWERNLDDGLITWSDEIYRMVGLSREDQEPLTEWQHLLHPDDRDRIATIITEAQAGFRRYDVEYRIRRPDGSVRWLHSQGDILRDEAGRARRAFGITQDITEGKHAEEALRRSEDRIRLIIDTIPVMAWSVRPDGVVDFLNQGWMDYAGLSLEEYVKDPLGPIHPQDRSRVIEKWSAQMARGEFYEDEMRLRRADGEYRWFLVRTAPLPDEQGNIVAWYGVSIDIEDRTRAEEQLRGFNQSLRALSARLNSVREEESTRIAREIHDELGGILSILKWDLEELEEVLSNPLTSDTLLELRGKVAAMITTTHSVVQTVTRISSELRPTALDDLGLIDALLLHAQQFQTRTGITVSCNCEPNAVELTREKSIAVFRIFQEALTNILRHAGATEVEVTTGQINDEFILTISDNGRGITEDEKFGTQSIGIIGMRERAHLVGGEIKLDNVNGRGTRITVRVPI
jgi:PAS domain S-box-containing protein